MGTLCFEQFFCKCNAALKKRSIKKESASSDGVKVE